MTVLNDMLVIGDREPVAEGTHCRVYAVPFNNQLVVKVMREDLPVAVGLRRRLKRWSHRRLPSLRYRPLIREYAAYMAVRREQMRHGGDMPIAQCCGIIATDQGLGVLYEKVSLTGQELGPSVGQLARENKLLPMLPMLNEFVRRLFEWNIHANDINRGNIVLGSRDGRQQFVLVDGLGDSHLIPIRTWFRFCNQRSLHRRIARMAAKLSLSWDSHHLCFVDGSR